MSAFSDVDASPRPQELLAYLEHAHTGLHSPKLRLQQGLPVRPGLVAAARADALLAEQRDLSASGGFHATLNRSTLAWAR